MIYLTLLGSTLILAATIFFKPKRKPGLLTTANDNKIILVSLDNSNISSSPFVAKTQCLLRKNKVPFESVLGTSLDDSPNKKIPYIHFKGEIIADSHFIQRRLIKEGIIKDFDLGLTEAENAQNVTCRHTIENFLYGGLVYERWDDNWMLTKEMYFRDSMPWFIYQFVPDYIIQPKVLQRLVAQGVKSYSREQYTELLHDSIKALSNQLGEKKYFILNNRMTSVDYSAFGFFANVLEYPELSPILFELVNRFPNLVKFVNQVKKDIM